MTYSGGTLEIFPEDLRRLFRLVATSSPVSDGARRQASEPGEADEGFADQTREARRTGGSTEISLVVVIFLKYVTISVCIAGNYRLSLSRSLRLVLRYCAIFASLL